MSPINVHANVHIASAKADDILEAVNALTQKVQVLTMANAETNALLDQLKTYTDRLAATAEAQATKLQEISDDIDKLLENVPDPKVQAKLQAHADALAGIAAAEEAQSETLTAIAAKREDPLPPPVEPEPVS